MGVFFAIHVLTLALTSICQAVLCPLLFINRYTAPYRLDKLHICNSGKWYSNFI